MCVLLNVLILLNMAEEDGLVTLLSVAENYLASGRSLQVDDRARPGIGVFSRSVCN